MDNVCAVVLAAGEGKRMKSARPKVLCEVLFRPMISWVADICDRVGVQSCLAVLGPNADEVRAVLPSHFQTALQSERRGTGHALLMARDYIRDGGFRDVLVLYGDAPFVRARDLRAAHDQHIEQGNSVTVISSRVDDPTGYGRIVRDGSGVVGIVEQMDADSDTLEIGEVNSGAYWFDAAFLLDYFTRMSADNAKGEYYLTDTVALAVEQHLHVDAFLAHPDSVLGANDRKSLSKLNELARVRYLDHWMEQGVDIPFPNDVVVGPKVRLGPDTRLLPGTILRGDTSIGRGCEIGPNAQLIDAQIGDGCQIISSYVERSTVRDGAKIGPMTNIRPDCDIGPGVKIGDFVEIKNSTIGAETAVAHLTYVGDSDVGERCNFGCGVVTVNYDGRDKHRTTIGDEAFIGCNANLVAPVRIGNRAYCAAGTTVTEDVPDDALAIGRSKQSVKEGWGRREKKYKKANYQG